MIWKARDSNIDLDKPILMGILNISPDSFSGDGVSGEAAAIEFARAMLAQGAAIIDVGGESSRPGASAVSVSEELERVVPVVKRLAKMKSVVISVDTRKPEVAEAVLKAGAHIINDITGLADGRMAEAVARHQAGLVIMHMQGSPDTMQLAPKYNDVVTEVGEFFDQRIHRAWVAGIPKDRIAIDPGIGFGKTMNHNLALLRATGHFRRRFEQPVLLGVSRKRFIGTLTGHDIAADRIYGTVALTAMMVQAGANILRVHDVGANRDALEMAWALNSL